MVTVELARAGARHPFLCAKSRVGGRASAAVSLGAILLAVAAPNTGCRSLRSGDAVRENQCLILEADPRALVAQSDPATLVAYVVVFRGYSGGAANEYGVFRKWFDSPVASESEVLQPQLTGEEIATLHRSPDLRTLAEHVKRQADDGYYVYTVSPEQLFAPGTAHPRVRALTRAEVATVQRFAAE